MFRPRATAPRSEEAAAISSTAPTRCGGRRRASRLSPALPREAAAFQAAAHVSHQVRHQPPWLNQIAAPHVTRLGDEAVKPLHAPPAHPERGRGEVAGKPGKESAKTEHHRRVDPVPILQNPPLLARHAHADTQNVRLEPIDVGQNRLVFRVPWCRVEIAGRGVDPGVRAFLSGARPRHIPACPARLPTGTSSIHAHRPAGPAAESSRRK